MAAEPIVAVSLTGTKWPGAGPSGRSSTEVEWFSPEPGYDSELGDCKSSGGIADAGLAGTGSVEVAPALSIEPLDLSAGVGEDGCVSSVEPIMVALPPREVSPAWTLSFVHSSRRNPPIVIRG